MNWTEDQHDLTIEPWIIMFAQHWQLASVVASVDIKLNSGKKIGKRQQSRLLPASRCDYTGELYYFACQKRTLEINLILIGRILNGSALFRGDCDILPHDKNTIAIQFASSIDFFINCFVALLCVVRCKTADSVEADRQSRAKSKARHCYY